MSSSIILPKINIAPQNRHIKHELRRGAWYSITALLICIMNIVAQSKTIVLATIVVFAFLLIIVFFAGAKQHILYGLIIYSPFSLRLNLGTNFALSSDLLLFDLFAILLMIDFIASQKYRIRVQSLASAVVLFTVTLTFLTVASSDIGTSLRKAFYLVHYLLIFVVITTQVKTEKQVETSLFALISVAGIISLAALAVFMMQFQPGFDVWHFRNWLPENVIWLLHGQDAADAAVTSNNWIIPLGNVAIFRTFFPFINPMALATYLLLIFPVMLSYIIYNPLLPQPFFFKLNFIVVSATIILSFARSVWLGMILATIITLLGKKAIFKLFIRSFVRLKMPKWFIIAPLLLVVAIVLMIAVPSLRERLFSIADMNNASNLDRFYTWQLSWSTFKENPLVGVGLGVFAEKHYSHNAYLDFAVETGIVGLGLFIFMFIASLGEAISVRNQAKSNVMQCMAIGWIAAILGLLVHFFFDNEFFFPQNGVAIIIILALIKSAYLINYRNVYAHRN